MWNESRGNIAVGMDRKNYSAGVAQISKRVWQSYSSLPYSDAAKPQYYKQNLEVAAQYLKVLHRKYNNWTLALAAYNDGASNINLYLQGKRDLPAITRHYIAGFNV